jgi:predicted XRE-type DNA-binding protein
MIVRAQLLSALRDTIEASGLSQREIAKSLGIKQPRITEFMGMKTQLFSSDLLMKLLSRMGKTVSVTIKNKRQVA